MEYRGQSQEKHSDSPGLRVQQLVWGEYASAQHTCLKSLIGCMFIESYLTVKLGNLEPGLLQNFLQADDLITELSILFLVRELVVFIYYVPENP